MSDVPLTNQNLQYVHPLVQNLLRQEQWSHLPVAGRLKHFQKSWVQLTSDPQVSEIIEAYQIPFLSEPKQMKPLNPVHLSETENSLLENQSHAKKRCHSDDEGLSKSVFKPIIFFDREETRAKNEPKYPIRSIQNGGSITFTGASSESWFFMQTRPKG